MKPSETEGISKGLNKKRKLEKRRKVEPNKLDEILVDLTDKSNTEDDTPNTLNGKEGHSGEQGRAKNKNIGYQVFKREVYE